MMKGFSIALIFFLLWVGPPVRGDEETPVAEQEITVFPECPTPVLEESDDFFKVNPTLRAQYYEYHRSLNTLHEDIYGRRDQTNVYLNDFVLEAKFRLFVEDFFKNNRELLQHSRHLYMELQTPSQDIDRIPYRKMFEEIDKYAGRLAGKIDFLVPGSLANARDDSLEKEFEADIQSNVSAALIGQLFLRIQDLQDEVCHFFFPDRFTVNFEELNGQSTPFQKLKEIAHLADELADRFPKHGMPADLEKPHWLLTHVRR
jgi:hypothetical protein